MWLTHWRIFTVFNINLSKTSNTLVCFVSKRHNSHSTLLSSGISKSTSLIKRHSGYLRKSVKKKKPATTKNKEKKSTLQNKTNLPCPFPSPQTQELSEGSTSGIPRRSPSQTLQLCFKKGLAKLQPLITSVSRQAKMMIGVIRSHASGHAMIACWEHRIWPFRYQSSQCKNEVARLSYLSGKFHVKWTQNLG